MSHILWCSGDPGKAPAPGTSEASIRSSVPPSLHCAVCQVPARSGFEGFEIFLVLFCYSPVLTVACPCLSDGEDVANSLRVCTALLQLFRGPADKSGAVAGAHSLECCVYGGLLMCVCVFLAAAPDVQEMSRRKVIQQLEQQGLLTALFAEFETYCAKAHAAVSKGTVVVLWHVGDVLCSSLVEPNSGSLQRPRTTSSGRCPRCAC